MFLGTHEPKLDEKGRIILPARFREELAKGLVITKGQERCLYVFPAKEFSAITDRPAAAPVAEDVPSPTPTPVEDSESSHMPHNLEIENMFKFLNGNS